MIGVRSLLAFVFALGALLSAAPALAQPGYYGPYPPGPYYAPYPPPRYVPPPPYGPPPYVPPPPPVRPYYAPEPPPPPPPPVVDRGYWGVSLGGAGLYSVGKEAPGFVFSGGFRTFSRLSPLDAEFELGVGHFEDLKRTDYKLGFNVYASFSKGVVVPYVVAPLALHIVSSPSNGTNLEGSAGFGLGLGVRVWRVMISADARIHYQDDFEGIVQDDILGEGRVTLTVFPWGL